MSTYSIWNQIKNSCTCEVFPTKFNSGDWNVSQHFVLLYMLANEQAAQYTAAQRGMLYTDQQSCRYITALDQTSLWYGLLKLQQLQQNSRQFAEALGYTWLKYLISPAILGIFTYAPLIIYKSSYTNLMSSVLFQHSVRSNELRTTASLHGSYWVQICETAWGQLHIWGLRWFSRLLSLTIFPSFVYDVLHLPTL